MCISWIAASTSSGLCTYDGKKNACIASGYNDFQARKEWEGPGIILSSGVVGVGGREGFYG